MARGCETARGGRLYVLGDPKSFYAPARTIWEFELAPSLLASLAVECPSATRIRTALRQRGVDAILYSVGGMISMVKMSKASLAGPALGRLQEFWRDWAEPAWIEESPAENCYYQCFTLRDRAGAFARPTSALWWTVPGTEVVTNPIDIALDAGRSADALAAARELAAAEPGFAPAWYRIWLAGRRLPDAGAAAQAAARLRTLGFGGLLK
jgi:hypothetical protein